MSDRRGAARPKVSVCVVTYNQEAYVRQCLQSIVDQEAPFDFEIVVGDDCSTDGTRAIVSEFAERYPEIVRPLFHEKNVGPYKNYLAVHALAQGQYVAHIDGDDYALPGKLTAQVAVLDASPDCNVVWHPVDTLYGDGVPRSSGATRPGEVPLRFKRSDQINFILIGAHSSKMYRAGVCELQIPEEGFTDFFLNVSHIDGGHAALLRDRAFGVHRVGIGISSSGHSTRRILIDNLNRLFRAEPENRAVVNSAILHLLLSDIKRRSPTLRASLSLFLRSFSLRGIGLYLQTFAMRKSLVL
jgi:glycosyltransferase involved in cell wall biosynthesis